MPPQCECGALPIKLWARGYSQHEIITANRLSHNADTLLQSMMSIHHPPAPDGTGISQLSKGNYEQLPYGIYVLQLKNGSSIALASAHNFETLLTQLEEVGKLNKDMPVLTPELITEIDGDKVRHDFDHVMGKIHLVQELSAKLPKLKILLGTPHWVEETCFNSVLVIQNGQILQVISKTYLTPGEGQDFASSDDDKPTISGPDPTQLLICSDLNAAGASLMTLVAAQAGKANPITEHPQLISPDTKILLVSACWGSGSNTPRELISQFSKVKNGEKTIDEFAQDFFQLMLQSAVNRVFDKYPDIDVIIVCDRAPTERGLDLQDTITSHKPLTGIFHRHNSTGSA